MNRTLYIGIGLIGLSIGVFAYNKLSPTAKASTAIASEVKPECDRLAAKYGKTCQGVIVVLK